MASITSYDVIKRPLVSERSMEQLTDRKYSFEVSRSANKIEIKKALEDIFGVEVERVTTMVVHGKVKRMGATSGKRPDWKKAIIKLTEQSKTIEFFDSLI